MSGRDFDGGEVYSPRKLPVQYHDIHYDKRWEVRQQYIELQDGKCWYCEQSLFKPPPKEITDKEINWDIFGGKRFLDAPIHLQHDHDTGWTEGAVHAYCNAVLWQYYRR